MRSYKDAALISAAELRRRAEEQLNIQPPEKRLAHEHETQRLLYELQVHQIELELQNAELRQTRDEVETALEKYITLYDFAPVGYFTLDSKGAVSAVNIAGACLIGGARSRLIGRNFRQFVAATDRPLFTEFLGAVLTSRIKEVCEVELLNKGNKKVNVQIEAMVTASGQEFHVVVIDITGRRHAEDALNRKRLELEELNSTLGERIAHAVDDLRQKDQILILQDRRVAMGEMINNIAHQWRQPLNALGLFLQDMPLVYDSAKLDREYLETTVSKSMQLIMHMSHTIDDFRNFFRSDKEIVPFNVNHVIVKTLSLIEESFKEINIVLQQEGKLIVSGYPNEVAQVIMNIMMNSRDALAGHNIDDGRISIRTFAEEGKAVVTVTDNAGGIGADIIDKLFDPYFTTKGPDKGTGIGLFMSKTIIEDNMGGRLTARNIGDGAEFRIEF